MNQQFYEQYDRYFPVASFFAGFSFDSVTLNRIDRYGDSLILLSYLLFLGTVIVVSNLVDKQVVRHRWLLKYHNWYPNVIQFLLGGLFSAYVIYYFQSTSMTRTAVFLLLLILLMIATELFEKRLTSIYLQVSMFFLSASAFFTFFLPVVSGRMSGWLFLLSEIISLLLAAAILYILYRKTALKSREQYWRALAVLAVLFLFMNLLYLFNWIPPVPLSMKDGGIFHHVHRVDEVYNVRYEAPAWYQFYRDDDDIFHHAPGDTVFCYASVFAPARLDTRIFHHWQLYSPRTAQWVTTDRMPYQIFGGRDGGYRGFTYKRNLEAGEWRVDVETEKGIVLGRRSFTLVPVDSASYRLVTRIRR